MANVFTVIFEDSDILVIDKPAGLRVDHDASLGTEGGAAEESVEDILNFPVDRHGIVHRIDKETSGILIVAKTQKSLESLKEQFKNHSLNKIYTTLVLGKTEEEAKIKNFLARDPKRKQAMKVIPYPIGTERGTPREAITLYKKISDHMFNNETLSLLEVTIKTGRTHQIRVHMQSVGHPVIGDQMYNSKTSKLLSDKLHLKRQFLHASTLEIAHPTSGKKMTFESPLAKDLQKVLDSLT